VSEFFKNLWDKVTAAIIDMINKVIEWLQKVVQWFKERVDEIDKWWKNIFG
jgi:hypothetical protein